MTVAVCSEVIAELEGAVECGSPTRRADMLRQITNLFLSGATEFNQHQIGVFDDVFIRLVELAEVQTLTRLSTILCDLTAAPKETVRRLARHEDAAVASPLLRKSETLSESDLAEIASCRGQRHLLAIAGRTTLSEAISDTILSRGDTAVCHALAKNSCARFSGQGYSKLVGLAERDDFVAEALVARSDMPDDRLRELVSRVTQTVQQRLLTVAAPQIRETIQAELEAIAVRASTKMPAPIDYSSAKSTVLALSKAGKLNDSAVNRFAVHGQRMNVIAALALLADAPIETIEPLMEENDSFGLVVACRASRLNWHTTLAVINSRATHQKASQQELERGKQLFDAVPLSVAQHRLRFGSVHQLAIPGLTNEALTVAGAIS